MKAYIQLHKGSSIVSRLIKWQTRSQYSHASVWFVAGDDIAGGTVIESVEGHGVRALPADRFAQDRAEGRISVYAIPTLTTTQARAVRDYMTTEIGRKYDWRAVFKFITRRTHGSDDRWFCSELVFAAFQHAGVTLFNGTEAWAVWPGQLATSTLVRRIGLDEVTA